MNDYSQELIQAAMNLEERAKAFLADAKELPKEEEPEFVRLCSDIRGRLEGLKNELRQQLQEWKPPQNNAAVKAVAAIENRIDKWREELRTYLGGTEHAIDRIADVAENTFVSLSNKARQEWRLEREAFEKNMKIALEHSVKRILDAMQPKPPAKKPTKPRKKAR